jgi:predicted nucleic acid-binding protein
VLASIGNWPSNPTQATQIWLAAQVLSMICTRCHSVVLDEENEIYKEYDPYLRSEDILQKWFISMSNTPGKFISRPRKRLELDVNLDPDDLKFLEVATNSPHRTIITGDSDLLSIRNEEQIVNLGIRILTAEEALREL